jgi:hypothetical protein
MPSLIVFRSSVDTIIYPYTYPIRATDRNVLKLEYLVQARSEKPLEIMTSKLSRGDLGREFFDLTGGIGPTFWIFQQWPGIQAFALSLPLIVAKKMSKPLKDILTLLEVFELPTFPHLVSVDIFSNL